MEPPIKPDESDCCNSGCIPCILDVYEEQLRKYRKGVNKAPKITDNCLSPISFTIFKLVNIEKHSRDCNLYTFEYVGPEKQINTLKDESNVSVLLEPGQHLLVKATIYGETFQKAYTPLYMENQPKNQFTILVKLYENGRMSRFFRRLEPGCGTLWRGPYGDYKISYEEKHLLFIAQGTGIAPFYSIICDILSNDECYTFLRLFFCCHVDNLLLREELYKLLQYWNFRYELFISRSDQGSFKEKYNEVVNFSRLGPENIKNYFKEVKESGKVLVCGAQSFCDIVKDMLMECGVPNDDITVF